MVTLKFGTALSKELLTRHRITMQQLDYLERALPEVAECLAPAGPSAAVKAQLARVAAEATQLQLTLERLRQAVRPEPGAQAFGHLMTHAALERRRLEAESELRAWPDILEAAAYVAAASQAAAAQTWAKRSRRVASAQAILEIVVALHRHPDDESRAAAARLPVSRYEPKGDCPSFAGLARTVFQVATGDEAASPDASIRQWLEQEEKHRRALAGMGLVLQKVQGSK